MMPGGASLETKRAMFWAAVVAECAGEPYVTASRVVASLLRTRSVIDLCDHEHIDSARVLDAVEDPRTMSFEACERTIIRELESKGVAFASREHRALVETRPMDPVLRPVVGNIIERYGHIG